MVKNVHRYYVYTISNKRNGTLCTGMTNNLEQRVFEHKSRAAKGFIQKYASGTLVYLETHQDVSNAILREKVRETEKT